MFIITCKLALYLILPEYNTHRHSGGILNIPKEDVADMYTTRSTSYYYFLLKDGRELKLPHDRCAILTKPSKKE